MDAPRPRFRVQFNLRWLFVAMTGCAVCALVYRLAGGYDDDARAPVRSLAADEPELGKEFQRALLDHNLPEIRALVSRVRQEAEASEER